MSRGSYVVHNASFDCGGPWGIIEAVLAAYVEARTGRKFNSFFDTLTGASIGGVNALVLGLGIDAKTLAHCIYACSIDLFKDSTDDIIRNQILNLKFGLDLKDHHEHLYLYYTLLPHFLEKTLSDMPATVLIAAHNMEQKLNFWFGRMDPALFDESALKNPLLNGTTRLMDVAMAATSIPGVFHPWEVNGEHYRDFGPGISAGKIHKEVDAALQKRFRQMAQARRGTPMSRREALSFRFARNTRGGPRTLENADGAVVRTLFVGAGDVSKLPYTKAKQFKAGIMGAMSDDEYSTLHLIKQSAAQEERADMEMFYDDKTIAATGRPAITRINKSLVWKEGDEDERASFPSLKQMDCSPANLQKLFVFAALSLQQNLPKLAEVLREITINQVAQGRIQQDEYERMIGICDAMATENPFDLLKQEGILVTAENAREIYERHRAHMPDKRIIEKPRPSFSVRAKTSAVQAAGSAASAATRLWRKPAPVIGG